MLWKVMLLGLALTLTPGCGNSSPGDEDAKKPKKQEEFPEDEDEGAKNSPTTDTGHDDEAAPPARVENPLRKNRDAGEQTVSFATPKACIEALVKACREKDQAAYGACLSRDCEPELRAAVDDDASFDEICAAITAATFATDEIVIADDEAICDLTIDGKAETLHLRRENGEWRVMGA